MTNFTPLDLKILISSVLAAIATPGDFVVKFLIPILSGIAWVFLKPVVERWRRKCIERKKQKKK